MSGAKKKAKNAALTTACIVSGNALLAFLVAAFVIPHDIIMGGTTGIGIVMSKLIPQIDVPTFVLILNILMLLLGLIVLGKAFVMTTIVSSIIYPLFLELFQRIPGIDGMTSNPLTAAIFAGCLLGVSLGLVMRVGSSTGGSDIINLVLAKVFHQPVALFVWLCDIIVVGGQAVFAPAEATLYAIIVIVLETLILDRVMLVGKSQIQLFIISKEYEKLRELLLDTLEAGVTMAMIETGKLGESQKGIICVIPPRKLYDATELVKKADPHAFITVTQIKEVRGRGFTEDREEL